MAVTGKGQSHVINRITLGSMLDIAPALAGITERRPERLAVLATGSDGFSDARTPERFTRVPPGGTPGSLAGRMPAGYGPGLPFAPRR